jgi:hypothetical protein
MVCRSQKDKNPSSCLRVFYFLLYFIVSKLKALYNISKTLNKLHLHTKGIEIWQLLI